MDHFGFKYKKIWESSYLENDMTIESHHQQHFQHLPLGKKRLWRHHVPFPAHRDLREAGNHMVYMTWSTQVPVALVAEHMKVVP